MDYEGYLRWWERVEISEYFNCIRRDVFRDLRYANSRAWEASFHLGLARQWELEFSDEALVLIHTDATNRLTTGKGRAACQRLLADAPDKLADALAMFSEHEEALRRWAPRRTAGIMRESVKQALLSGKRRVAASLLWRNPASMNLRRGMIFGLGLASRRLLAWANARF